MTDDKPVTIEVDGKVLKARAGAMLIDVTDEAGIPIPRFCYHKKLSVAANCRMCLVDVENVPKPLPACATPVNDGMKVHTRSPKALAAQQGTMEFLLINHPLDCPICDQGGECELQDVALGYGQSVSRYVEGKRVVKDEDLGPLIATDMTRCIHCTRCVRFGSEIAGIREMGATGRGEHMRIGTYVAKTVDHELSGNIIDLCPVGALTSKPYRYQARAWELVQSDSVASHDSVGSNVHVHVRRNQLLRVHPRDNEAVNETWISDRDRFSYQGLYADDRLHAPMIKKNGQWQEVPWEVALEQAANGLKHAAEQREDQLVTLVSPRATLEEMYLAQKITRGLGSPNIDSRLRQGAFSDAEDPLFPWLGMPIADLEQADTLLIIGSRLRKDQPLLAHRVRNAARAGASVIFVNPLEMVLTHAATQLVGSPTDMLNELAGIARALGAAPITAKGLPAARKATARQKTVAEALKHADKSVVLLGDLVIGSDQATLFKALANSVAKAAGATLGYLPAAANAVGAALAGALPHVLPGAKPVTGQIGGNARELLAKKRSAYLLVGFDPAFDTWDPAQSLQTLQQADCVVAMTAWFGSALREVADIVLPMGDFAETAGTYVNAGGRWQAFQGAVMAPGETRPGWKILRVLGNMLGVDGCGYSNSTQIRDELKGLCDGVQPNNSPRGDYSGRLEPLADGQLQRIGDVPIYAVDGLVRRAPALQSTADAITFGVWLNPAEAQRLGVQDGDEVTIHQAGASAKAAVTIDKHIPEGCARIPAALDGSEKLGAPCGPVTLEKV